MTTTLTRGHVPSNGSKAEPVGIEPAKRRSRSVPLALVAGACMLVSIVAFVGLQLASTDRKPMLAVARPVEAGAVITDEDLTVAQVADDPSLSPMPLSAKASVVGKTAAVDLRPGTLLVSSALGDSSPVASNEALVGVEVPAAAAPVGALRSGQNVQLVDAPKTGDTTGKAGGVIAQGRIVRVSSGSNTSSSATQLSIVVPSDKAPAVAAASAAQRVAVVVVP